MSDRTKSPFVGWRVGPMLAAAQAGLHHRIGSHC